jgi:hypothetical protein
MPIVIVLGGGCNVCIKGVVRKAKKCGSICTTRSFVMESTLSFESAKIP